MKNKLGGYLVGFVIAFAFIASAAGLTYAFNLHSFSSPVTCTIDVDVSHEGTSILKFNVTTPVWPRSKSDDINKAVTMLPREIGYEIQLDLGLPTSSWNWKLFGFSSYTDDHDCSKSSVDLVIDNTAGIEHGFWSDLRAVNVYGNLVLRTTTTDGDYIEIPLSNEDLEYLFRAHGPNPRIHTMIVVLGDPEDAGVIKGDGTGLVARFRWSSLESKRDVMRMLARTLDVKWQEQGAKGEAAMFVQGEGVIDFSTSRVELPAKDSWPPIRIFGLDAAMNEASAVTGALYWK